MRGRGNSKKTYQSLTVQLSHAIICRLRNSAFYAKLQAKELSILKYEDCFSERLPANQIAFFSVRANKFAKWKTGFSVSRPHLYPLSYRVSGDL